MKQYNLKFYKENGRWYADVPNHTQEENEMVFGSDTLLDQLSCGGSRVEVNFTTEPNDKYCMKLKRTEHDEDGAFYVISTMQGSDVEDIGVQLWICNVTHDVCGEHPEYIYLNYN